MATGILVGRFLILGLVAWVAAIVLGVGARFEFWRWRDRWPLAGALAGLGTFGLFLYTTPISTHLMAWTSILFIGAGIALSYGTLFLRTQLVRPRLEEGSAEEHLWLRDAVDALRPQSLDWVLTGAVLAPGVGLIYLGLNQVHSAVPVVIGAVSLLGPLYAGVGLALRARVASRIALEIVEREQLDSDEDLTHGIWGRTAAGLETRPEHRNAAPGRTP